MKLSTLVIAYITMLWLVGVFPTQDVCLSHLPVMAKSFDSSLLTIKYENEYSGFLMGQLLNEPVLTEWLLGECLLFLKWRNIVAWCLYGSRHKKRQWILFDFCLTSVTKVECLLSQRPNQLCLWIFQIYISLHTHICTLANKLKTQKFKIVPLKISDCSVESNNGQLPINQSENFAFTAQEISNYVNSEKIQTEKSRLGKSKTRSILPETKT